MGTACSLKPFYARAVTVACRLAKLAFPNSQMSRHYSGVTANTVARQQGSRARHNGRSQTRSGPRVSHNCFEMGDWFHCVSRMKQTHSKCRAKHMTVMKCTGWGSSPSGRRNVPPTSSGSRHQAEETYEITRCRIPENTVTLK